MPSIDVWKQPEQNKTTLMVQQLNAWMKSNRNYNICIMYNNKMTKRLNEPNHFHDIWSINVMNGMVAATFNNIFVRLSIHSSVSWYGCMCIITSLIASVFGFKGSHCYNVYASRYISL